MPPRDAVHPDITKPDSSTHFLCPEGPMKDGKPVATHHFNAAGPSKGRSRICFYCGLTDGQIRERNGLA